LGSQVNFVNGSLNPKFVIPPKQLDYVSPLEAKKKRPSYESTLKFQISWATKLLKVELQKGMMVVCILSNAKSTQMWSKEVNC
jgi:hypothetical protein